MIGVRSRNNKETNRMKNTIQVEVRSSYGRDLIYPSDEGAKGFCRLLGNQKTLTDDDINNIKKLGYEVQKVVFCDDKAIKVGTL